MLSLTITPKTINAGIQIGNFEKESGVYAPEAVLYEAPDIGEITECIYLPLEGADAILKEDEELQDKFDSLEDEALENIGLDPVFTQKLYDMSVREPWYKQDDFWYTPDALLFYATAKNNNASPVVIAQEKGAEDDNCLLLRVNNEFHQGYISTFKTDGEVITVHDVENGHSYASQALVILKPGQEVIFGKFKDGPISQEIGEYVYHDLSWHWDGKELKSKESSINVLDLIEKAEKEVVERHKTINYLSQPEVKARREKRFALKRMLKERHEALKPLFNDLASRCNALNMQKSIMLAGPEIFGHQRQIEIKTIFHVNRVTKEYFTMTNSTLKRVTKMVEEAEKEFKQVS